MQEDYNRPLVDIISEKTGEQVVMVQDAYVYLSSSENVNSSIVDEAIMTQKEEENTFSKQKEQSDAKRYLEDTDWIITKIAETTALNGDIEALKTKYATAISERKLARDLINSLEG